MAAGNYAVGLNAIQLVSTTVQFHLPCYSVQFILFSSSFSILIYQLLILHINISLFDLLARLVSSSWVRLEFKAVIMLPQNYGNYHYGNYVGNARRR